jgi:Fic family protein
MKKELIQENEILDFMAGSAMIFSGFAIKANSLEKKIDALVDIFNSLPEWIPASTLTESTGLTVDTIRKQLHNPKLFEPEVDFKQIGRIWYIHKNAITKVRRWK